MPIFFKILDFLRILPLYKKREFWDKNAVFLYHISSGCLRDSFGISAFRMTTINELNSEFEYKESAETSDDVSALSALFSELLENILARRIILQDPKNIVGRDSDVSESMRI